jgi:chromosome segregation ATPase
MTRLLMNCLIALVLCCLPVLAGCHDGEKQKALADLQITETALGDAKRELATNQATLDTIQKERDSLQKDLENLKGQNDALRQQIDRLTAGLQAFEAQREQLKTRADELTAQIASAREAAAKENDSLKTKIAALEEDLAQKVAQIQSLQEKVAEVQKTLDAVLKPPAKPAP